ncbi:MAG: hypothetical protein SGARI_002445, partial [Bacillariaceae sp.]
MSGECMEHYAAAKDNTTEYTGGKWLQAVLDIYNEIPQDFPDVQVGFEGQNSSHVLSEIRNYTATCVALAEELAHDLLNFTEDDLKTGVADMSFNWIRCWNSTLYGGLNPFRATKEQINATTHQEEFYHHSWQLEQEQLYNQYLEAQTCTDDDLECIDDAFDRSVDEATGSGYCS